LRESGKRPACYFDKCEIQDEAPDIELNQIVDTFLTFKSLDDDGYSKVKQQILEDSGLNTEPELLARLERVVSKARQIQLDKLKNKPKTHKF